MTVWDPHVRVNVSPLQLTSNLFTVSWDHLQPPMTLKDKLSHFMDGWIYVGQEGSGGVKL